MSKDFTFSDSSSFGTITWAAHRLGMSKDQFLRKRSRLEREGFPERDALTNSYLKADVDAWINLRRRIKDANDLASYQETFNAEVNLDAV